MSLPTRIEKAAVGVALAALAVLTSMGASPFAHAQQATDLAAELAAVPLPEPSAYALPLPEDRGQADLEQSLKRLGTTARVLYIVAHPDDEDGGLLTYLTRGMGARATLLTLTRGEGGQNAMSAESYDALGLIRTNELLRADEAYGVDQLWGTEADFGFSKTQEEAFASWGHERVLYDAVLAVRKTRPQVIVATFVGGITDGHGQHQVSGEIAQEAFKDAADPKVFPEQFKMYGLQPWQAQAVYSRAPFAAVTDKGMFDSATGKWGPAKFHNYVTGEWTTGKPTADVSVPVGSWDPVLGRTYVQIAREGWGEQKSQYGGASPQLNEPNDSLYHLWAVAPTASAAGNAANASLFDNSKVKIDTSLEGMARLAGANAPAWLSGGLHQIATGLAAATPEALNKGGVAGAHALVPVYKQTLDLYGKVDASDLKPDAKAELEFMLAYKIDAFQSAFKDLLGLDMIAFRTGSTGARGPAGPERGGTADETPASVTPGQTLNVRAHLAQSVGGTQVARVWLANSQGTAWTVDAVESPATGSSSGVDQAAARSLDRVFHVKVADDAQPTAPYFTRPTTEKATYDLTDEALRLRSFAPWPLQAWAEFTFEGVPIRLGGVVQTLQHLTGPGGFYEPLVVTPPIGVRIQPQAHLLPLDGSALQVKVTVQTQAAAEGSVALKLPAGWKSDPAEKSFKEKGAGMTEPLVFSVTPTSAGAGSYEIEAVAQVAGKSYETGWQKVGYQGLRPYNQYKAAKLETRKIDVKVAPGLRVGYVMGTGDTVPEAIAELGVVPHMLTAEELTTGDLSQWNVIVVGIRAYSNRPELTAAQARLEQFVESGGTMVVQYQSATFPAPLPLAMGRTPERVVVEEDPVKLLEPTDALLTWPNKITSSDFDGWFEERGHSFLDTWDPGYKALTETADPGQDPQRGGLIVTHPGKGTYIYAAYALYRQFPELVPGSYRILANLISAGQGSGIQ